MRSFARVAWLRSKINCFVGPQEPLLATVKRRKLAWFGRVNATTASTKPSFRAPWKVGDAVVGRRNAGWTNIKAFTSLPMPELLTRASCRKHWKRIPAESSLVLPRRPDHSELKCAARFAYCRNSAFHLPSTSFFFSDVSYIPMCPFQFPTLVDTRTYTIINY